MEIIDSLIVAFMFNINEYKTNTAADMVEKLKSIGVVLLLHFVLKIYNINVN